MMRKWNDFRFHNKGSVATIFGLSVFPLMGVAGAAVDYNRGTAVRVELQKATDVAALQIGRYSPQISDAQLQSRGQKIFNESFNPERSTRLTSVTITRNAQTVKVIAKAQIDTSIMKVVGFSTMDIGSESEVLWAVPPTEVALAIDSTGSMAADMPALRKASQDFTDTILGYGNPNVRMALVPYVASVNVGSSNLSSDSIDGNGQSRWHAQALKGQMIADLKGCNWNPYYRPPVVGNPTPWTPPPPEPGPRGNDRADGSSVFKTIGSVAANLFGITSAQAQGVTPNTDQPLSGPFIGPNIRDYTPNNEKGMIPNGFSYVFPCGLVNPTTISNLDLFNRLNVRWKGCVEARPEPFDVTDDAPSGNPASRFVPYFWPDEPGKAGVTGAYINNYLDDGYLPDGTRERVELTPSTDPFNPTPVKTTVTDRYSPGWNFQGERGQFVNLLKYNRSAKPIIKETAPATLGPNAGCPDEMVRLTTDRVKLVSQINKLSHWSSGGTISSEGVMWGWRALSPKAPFADGAAYGKARKFLVVMSDGLNSLQENNRHGPTKTDYTAYGYLKNGRFPSENYAAAEGYLNQRMQLACTNAKKEGIKIYTVMYRETNPIGRREMGACATDAKHAFFAANGNELRNIFSQIASEIITLRISK